MYNTRARTSENRFDIWESILSDPNSWLLLLISMAFALGIRLAFLGTKSLWLDEIWSVEIARMPWHAFLWVVRNMDPNTSLYYGLLHLWMSLGQSEFSLRLLSVLFSVLTLPPLFALGSHLLGRRAGAIASLLLAVNLFDIQWSQEARTYALLVFLVTLSSLYFIKSIEEPSRKNWVLYSSLSVFAVYAHIFAVLVLVAQLASLIFLRRRELPWKSVCLSGITVGIFTSPVAWLIVVRSRAPLVPLDWIPGPSIRHIYDLFCALSGKPEFDGAFGGRPLILLYFIACAAALLSLVRILRRNGRGRQAWRLAFLVCWALLPILLVLSASAFQSMLIARYFLISTPAIVLLATAGITQFPLPARFKQLHLGTALLLLIVAVQLAGLPQYFLHRLNSREWQTASNFILSQQRPGDAAIFFVAPGRDLFDYYRERSSQPSRQFLSVVYPEFHDERNDPQAIAYLPPLTDSMLQSLPAQHDRIWVVLYHDEWPMTRPIRQRIIASLNSSYTPVQVRNFPGLSVVLYAKPGPERLSGHSSVSLRQGNGNSTF